MSNESFCVVCADRPKDGVLLCKVCGQNYDYVRKDDGSIASVIEWAAKRARRCERARRERGRRARFVKKEQAS